MRVDHTMGLSALPIPIADTSLPSVRTPFAEGHRHARGYNHPACIKLYTLAKVAEKQNEPILQNQTNFIA
jgi:hypothetical protein